MLSLDEAHKAYVDANLSESKALDNLKVSYSADFLSKNPDVVKDLRMYLRCKSVKYLEADSYTSGVGNTTDYVVASTDLGKFAIVIASDDPIDVYGYEDYDSESTVVNLDDIQDSKFDTLKDKLYRFDYFFDRIVSTEYNKIKIDEKCFEDSTHNIYYKCL